MSTREINLASQARLELAAELEDAGLEASTDAGSFYPQPAGILIGLPTLVSRTLGGSTFTVPVTVVSGDPLNSEGAVATIYELADEASLALGTNNYRPTQYRSSLNAEPLPALELVVTVTISRGG